MFSIQNLISELSTKQINRLKKGLYTYEYAFFDISVFNAGASIKMRLTNTYKEINPNTWNGYDCILLIEDLVNELN